MALGLTQPLTDVSTRNISWEVKRPVRVADNPATFMCRLSWNLGASTSWNPQGLSRPVMGLLYLYMNIQLKMTTCLSIALWKNTWKWRPVPRNFKNPPVDGSERSASSFGRCTPEKDSPHPRVPAWIRCAGPSAGLPFCVAKNPRKNADAERVVSVYGMYTWVTGGATINKDL